MTSEISETGDIAYYFNDAKEHGVRVYSPNVNSPSAYFEVKNDGITYSLAAIKNFWFNYWLKKIVEDVKLMVSTQHLKNLFLEIKKME